MEATSMSTPLLTLQTSKTTNIPSHGYTERLAAESAKSMVSFNHSRRRQHDNNGKLLTIRKKRPMMVTTFVSVNDVSSIAMADSAPVVELTWQIVVGALAGVTPFMVAGIEFSKRIIAQKRCEVCNGSGLVLEDKDYFRCPQCGGFLPWQSWKRFFTG